MNKPIVEKESINSTLSEGTIKTSKKANIPREILIFNSCPEGNSKPVSYTHLTLPTKA